MEKPNEKAKEIHDELDWEYEVVIVAKESNLICWSKIKELADDMLEMLGKPKPPIFSLYTVKGDESKPMVTCIRDLDEKEE